MKYKDNKNKRGFTLIELIAVLVILALIALIATPLVMNIVKKAKDSTNKRSVDAYGKALELAVATHLLDTGDYPTSLDNLTVEYSGNEVVCNIKKLNEDGSIYLSECSVKGAEVKDSNTEDGYYHYGKTSTTAYQSYAIGDVITYNGMEFYVIENSDSKSDRVTLLKAEPLTVDEVNTYGGVGTNNNHVNVNIIDYDNYPNLLGRAFDVNGYGGMAYYSSLTCGYNGSSWVYDGCVTDYAKSEVKYVVDAWALDIFKIEELIEDETGYSVRLITFEELTNNLGYATGQTLTDFNYHYTENTPTWVYNSNYRYWSMSQYNDSSEKVHHVYGTLGENCSITSFNPVVRPVVTILKSAI